VTTVLDRMVGAVSEMKRLHFSGAM
jgi:hypothetical protein